MHDYGLENRAAFAVSDRWKLYPHQKVILCNVKACKNRITVGKIVKHLNGHKFTMLELTQAVWLTEAVVDAINANQPTADISKMFYCQLGNYNGEVFSKEDIAKKLFQKLFKKIDENEEQITVKLNWWCLL